MSAEAKAETMKEQQKQQAGDEKDQKQNEQQQQAQAKKDPNGMNQEQAARLLKGVPDQAAKYLAVPKIDNPAKIEALKQDKDW